MSNQHKSHLLARTLKKFQKLKDSILKEKEEKEDKKMEFKHLLMVIGQRTFYNMEKKFIYVNWKNVLEIIGLLRILNLIRSD